MNFRLIIPFFVALIGMLIALGYSISKHYENEFLIISQEINNEINTISKCDDKVDVSGCLISVSDNVKTVNGLNFWLVKAVQQNEHLSDEVLGDVIKDAITKAEGNIASRDHNKIAFWYKDNIYGFRHNTENAILQGQLTTLKNVEYRFYNRELYERLIRLENKVNSTE